MGTAGRQHCPVCLKMTATHHYNTVTQLAMDTLIVELLEDLLKVAGEIHFPEQRWRDVRDEISLLGGC